METHEVKPRLELRRDPRYGWEWWARVFVGSAFDFIRLGSARYVTLAEALRIYRSAV
jgi:hypothetical protein